MQEVFGAIIGIAAGIIIEIAILVICAKAVIKHKKEKMRRTNDRELAAIAKEGFDRSLKVEVTDVINTENSFVFCADSGSRKCLYILNGRRENLIDYEAIINYTVEIRERGTDMYKGKKTRTDAAARLSEGKTGPVLGSIGDGENISEISIFVYTGGTDKKIVFPEPLYSEQNGVDIMPVVSLEKVLWQILKVNIGGTLNGR